jgi:hypothetical protein
MWDGIAEGFDGGEPEPMMSGEEGEDNPDTQIEGIDHEG